MNTKKIFNDIFFDDLTQNEKNILQTQSSRELFVKIEIIDVSNDIVGEIAGRAINGNYNIDNSASLRRTCSVTFLLETSDLELDTLKSAFAINKKFILYVGLSQTGTNNVCWFNKGTYAIKDPNITVSINEQTITINGLDKMALHNGDISGQLEYATIIEVEEGVYVHDAVRAIMQDGGETKLDIAETKLLIPYKIESAIGDARYDVIEKLTNLFYNYQAYYNVGGTFVFAQKPTSANEGNDIAIDFGDKRWKNLIISIDRDIAYSNIKNKIVVYGGTHDDGYQPSYIIEVSDANYPSSPYTIDKLNEKHLDGSFIYRILVIQDDAYVDNGVAENANDNMEEIHAYSIDLCKQRAESEVYLHQQATDTITINCIPIYSLDVNEVIYLDDEQSGVQGKYVVNNISCGLGASDTMTITANKLW